MEVKSANVGVREDMGQKSFGGIRTVAFIPILRVADHDAEFRLHASLVVVIAHAVSDVDPFLVFDGEFERPSVGFPKIFPVEPFEVDIREA